MTYRLHINNFIVALVAGIGGKYAQYVTNLQLDISRRMAIICWLAMHKRPLTRDRLVRLGICQETSCAICGEATETTDHLYFECPFSKAFTQEALQWMNMGCNTGN